MEYADLRIYVLDNGSVDGSQEVVRKVFPETILIENGKNLGCSEGRNRGMIRAIAEGARYLLLIDNDGRPEPGLARTLVEAAEADDRIGIIGPVIYRDKAGGRGAIWTAGLDLVYWMDPVRRRWGRKPMDRTLEDVDSLPANGMLIRKEVCEQVGLFDSAYFFGCEDSDICLRAKAAGYRVMVHWGATLLHRVSSSLGGYYTPLRNYHLMYAYMTFLRRHGRWPQQLTFAASFFPAMAVALLREILIGDPLAVIAKIRGTLDGLANRPLSPRGLPPAKRPPFWARRNA